MIVQEIYFKLTRNKSEVEVNNLYKNKLPAYRINENTSTIQGLSFPSGTCEHGCVRKRMASRTIKSIALSIMVTNFNNIK
jgi:hypothetical protein